jgi:hypothetical protein
VHLTERADRAVEEIWGPIAADAMAELRGFTSDELRVIESFLRRALDNQTRHAERLRSSAGGPHPS